MKKILAYCILILANSILLTHAILPHQHHHDTCTGHSDCKDDLAMNMPRTPMHGHNHNEAESSTCVLKQAIVIPSTQNKLLKSCDSCSEYHNHHFCFLSKQDYIFTVKVSVSEQRIPVLHSFYTSIVSPTLGLRAPPTV